MHLLSEVLLHNTPIETRGALSITVVRYDYKDGNVIEGKTQIYCGLLGVEQMNRHMARGRAVLHHLSLQSMGPRDATAKQIYRCGIRMRFRPNRRASTDHAPGPSIASAAPNAPSRMCIHGSVGCEKAR